MRRLTKQRKAFAFALWLMSIGLMVYNGLSCDERSGSWDSMVSGIIWVLCFAWHAGIAVALRRLILQV